MGNKLCVCRSLESHVLIGRNRYYCHVGIVNLSTCGIRSLAVLFTILYDFSAFDEDIYIGKRERKDDRDKFDRIL